MTNEVKVLLVVVVTLLAVAFISLPSAFLERKQMVECEKKHRGVYVAYRAGDRTNRVCIRNTEIVDTY